MRIGIDASRANLDKKTGVEWYSYHLIEFFKRIDKDNQYFLYSQSNLSGDLGVLPDNFKNVILTWKYKKFWTQLKLPDSANKHKNNILFIPSGIVPVFSFWRRYKLITTIHDLCFLEHPEYYSSNDLKIQKLGLQLAIMFSKKIITVSNFTKTQILKYTKCREDKIRVTYLGYDSKVYNTKIDEEEAQRIKKKYELPNKFILFIGRIEEKKNIINQIKAFQKFNQKHSEFKFVIIGKPGYGYDNIRTQIFDENIYKNIIELGWIKDEELSIILKLSSVFMFLSYYEGFGIPIIQAMASGVPVITSSTTSMPEIAGDAALLNEPNNIWGISENLSNIVDNKDGIRDILIEKGLERAKKFSWKKCAKQTLDVFKELEIREK